jgi:thiol-disulfide isomerase/thioredoxin
MLAMRQPAFSLRIPFVPLLVTFLALAASGQAQKPGSKSAPSAPLSAAPDFALQSIYGETVHLSDFRGKVVLLYFWATWCAPCKIEMPWFVELQNQYGPEGLQIVGISLDEDASPADVAEFADSMRANYPILIGNEIVSKAYGGVPVLPMAFFIAREGKVVDKIIGIKSKAEIGDAIKKALNPGSPTNQAPASENAPAPQPQR